MGVLVRGPTFFLNRALLRLNLALIIDTACLAVGHLLWLVRLPEIFCWMNCRL